MINQLCLIQEVHFEGMNPFQHCVLVFRVCYVLMGEKILSHKMSKEMSFPHVQRVYGHLNRLYMQKIFHTDCTCKLLSLHRHANAEGEFSDIPVD